MLQSLTRDTSLLNSCAIFNSCNQCRQKYQCCYWNFSNVTIPAFPASNLSVAVWILRHPWLATVFLYSTDMSVIGYNDHLFTERLHRYTQENTISACEHKGQSELFKNPLNRAQNVSWKCCNNNSYSREMLDSNNFKTSTLRMKRTYQDVLVFIVTVQWFI